MVVLNESMTLRKLFCEEKEGILDWQCQHVPIVISWQDLAEVFKASMEKLREPGAAIIPSPIQVAIDSSRYILDLCDDWDGEGTPGYSSDTWDRTVQYLMMLDGNLRRMYGISLDPPRISPSGNGSIDLHWKTLTYELLINLKADPSAPAEYYGDNTEGVMPLRGSSPQGSIDRRLPAWLSLFL